MWEIKSTAEITVLFVCGAGLQTVGAFIFACNA